MSTARYNVSPYKGSVMQMYNESHHDSTQHHSSQIARSYQNQAHVKQFPHDQNSSLNYYHTNPFKEDQSRKDQIAKYCNHNDNKDTEDNHPRKYLSNRHKTDDGLSDTTGSRIFSARIEDYVRKREPIIREYGVDNKNVGEIKVQALSGIELNYSKDLATQSSYGCEQFSQQEPTFEKSAKSKRLNETENVESIYQKKKMKQQTRAVFDGMPHEVETETDVSHDMLSYDVLELSQNSIQPISNASTVQSIFVWGSNAAGQLGLTVGNFGKFYQPIELKFKQEIQQVSCGAHHTAMVTVSKQLFVMGSNSRAQLGLGDPREILRCTIPTLVQSLAHLHVIKVECGANHTLSIAKDIIGARGTHVYAWGDNSRGQTGASEADMVISPHKIHFQNSSQGGEIFSADKISAGKEHTFFLDLKSWQVQACGSSIQGQLGIGLGQEMQRVPIRVTSLAEEQIVEVACGDAHTLALNFTGQVLASGYNFTGQLGLGNTQSRYTFEWIEGLNNIIQVEASSHSCAIDSFGGLYRWGQCVKGIYLSPLKVVPPSPMLVEKVSIGTDFGIVQSKQGEVFTYGVNMRGQLGQGDCEPRSTLNPLTTINQFGQSWKVAAGNDFVMCLVNRGRDRRDQKKPQEQLSPSVRKHSQPKSKAVSLKRNITVEQHNSDNQKAAIGRKQFERRKIFSQQGIPPPYEISSKGHNASTDYGQTQYFDQAVTINSNTIQTAQNIKQNRAIHHEHSNYTMQDWNHLDSDRDQMPTARAFLDNNQQKVQLPPQLPTREIAHSHEIVLPSESPLHGMMPPYTCSPYNAAERKGSKSQNSSHHFSYSSAHGDINLANQKHCHQGISGRVPNQAKQTADEVEIFDQISLADKLDLQSDFARGRSRSSERPTQLPPLATAVNQVTIGQEISDNDKKSFRGAQGELSGKSVSINRVRSHSPTPEVMIEKFMNLPPMRQKNTRDEVGVRGRQGSLQHAVHQAMPSFSAQEPNQFRTRSSRGGQVVSRNSLHTLENTGEFVIPQHLPPEDSARLKHSKRYDVVLQDHPLILNLANEKQKDLMRVSQQQEELGQSTFIDTTNLQITSSEIVIEDNSGNLMLTSIEDNNVANNTAQDQTNGWTAATYQTMSTISNNPPHSHNVQPVNRQSYNQTQKTNFIECHTIRDANNNISQPYVTSRVAAANALFHFTQPSQNFSKTSVPERITSWRNSTRPDETELSSSAAAYTDIHPPPETKQERKNKKKRSHANKKQSKNSKKRLTNNSSKQCIKCQVPSELMTPEYKSYSTKQQPDFAYGDSTPSLNNDFSLLQQPLLTSDTLQTYDESSKASNRAEVLCQQHRQTQKTAAQPYSCIPKEQFPNVCSMNKTAQHHHCGYPFDYRSQQRLPSPVTTSKGKESNCQRCGLAQPGQQSCSPCSVAIIAKQQAKTRARSLSRSRLNQCTNCHRADIVTSHDRIKQVIEAARSVRRPCTSVCCGCGPRTSQPQHQHAANNPTGISNRYNFQAHGEISHQALPTPDPRSAEEQRAKAAQKDETRRLRKKYKRLKHEKNRAVMEQMAETEKLKLRVHELQSAAQQRDVSQREEVMQKSIGHHALIEKYTKELSTLQQKVCHLERKLVAKDSEIQEAYLENSEINEKLSSLNNELQQIRADNETLKQDARQIVEELELMGQVKREQELSISTLKEQLESKSRLCEDSESSLAHLSKTLDDLRANFDIVKTDSNQTLVENDQLRAVLRASEEKLEVYEELVDNLRKRVVDLESSNKDLVHHLDDKNFIQANDYKLKVSQVLNDPRRFTTSALMRFSKDETSSNAGVDQQQLMSRSFSPIALRHFKAQSTQLCHESRLSHQIPDKTNPMEHKDQVQISQLSPSDCKLSRSQHLGDTSVNFANNVEYLTKQFGKQQRIEPDNASASALKSGMTYDLSQSLIATFEDTNSPIKESHMNYISIVDNDQFKQPNEGTQMQSAEKPDFACQRDSESGPVVSFLTSKAGKLIEQVKHLKISQLGNYAPNLDPRHRLIGPSITSPSSRNRSVSPTFEINNTKQRFQASHQGHVSISRSVSAKARSPNSQETGERRHSVSSQDSLHVQYQKVSTSTSRPQTTTTSLLQSAAAQYALEQRLPNISKVTASSQDRKQSPPSLLTANISPTGATDLDSQLQQKVSGTERKCPNFLSKPKVTGSLLRSQLHQMHETLAQFKRDRAQLQKGIQDFENEQAMQKPQ